MVEFEGGRLSYRGEKDLNWVSSALRATSREFGQGRAVNLWEEFLKAWLLGSFDIGCP